MRGGGSRGPNRQLGGDSSAIAPVPSGELSSTTSTRASGRHAARHHRARGSRARCRSGGTPSRAPANHRVRACPGFRGTATSPHSSTSSAICSSPRGSAGLPRPRDSPCREPRPRTSSGSIAELAVEGKAKELGGSRKDDRGEDRPDRRRRRDPRADEAKGGDPARSRPLPPPPRPRSEDGRGYLEGARCRGAS